MIFRALAWVFGIHVHHWGKFSSPFNVEKEMVTTTKEEFTGEWDGDGDPIFNTIPLEEPIYYTVTKTYQRRICTSCGIAQDHKTTAHVV